MLVFNQRGKSMDVSLNPQFLTDLGMLVQIVFPKPTQSFMAKDEIICVLESNRKLLSIRNPFEGVFRAFNGPCEQLPEKYTADQVLFSVQPMTVDEYKAEQQEKSAKAAAKRKTPIMADNVAREFGADWGEPVEALRPLGGPDPRMAEMERVHRQLRDYVAAFPAGAPRVVPAARQR